MRLTIGLRGKETERLIPLDFSELERALFDPQYNRTNRLTNTQTPPRKHDGRLSITDRISGFEFSVERDKQRSGHGYTVRVTTLFYPHVTFRTYIPCMRKFIPQRGALTCEEIKIDGSVDTYFSRTTEVSVDFLRLVRTNEQIEHPVWDISLEKVEQLRALFDFGTRVLETAAERYGLRKIWKSMRKEMNQRQHERYLRDDHKRKAQSDYLYWCIDGGGEPIIWRPTPTGLYGQNRDVEMQWMQQPGSMYGILELTVLKDWPQRTWRATNIERARFYETISCSQIYVEDPMCTTYEEEQGSERESENHFLILVRGEKEVYTSPEHERVIVGKSKWFTSGTDVLRYAAKKYGLLEQIEQYEREHPPSRQQTPLSGNEAEARRATTPLWMKTRAA